MEADGDEPNRCVSLGVDAEHDNVGEKCSRVVEDGVGIGQSTSDPVRRTFTLVDTRDGRSNTDGRVDDDLSGDEHPKA